MLIHDDVRKKRHVVFKMFFALLKVFNLPCVPSFRSISTHSLSKKKYGEGNFTPTPPVSNYKVQIRRWE